MRRGEKVLSKYMILAKGWNVSSKLPFRLRSTEDRIITPSVESLRERIISASGAKVDYLTLTRWSHTGRMRLMLAT
jgi:hypothetical protein